MDRDEIRRSVLVTPQELNEMRLCGRDVTILAVQSINPYTGKSSFDGHRVPGAIDTQAYEDFQAPPSAEHGQRPLPDIAVLQAKARQWGLRPEATIIVYDADRSMTAARAWWVLKWAGLPDVRVLDGGLPAWVAAGLPTSQESAAPAPSSINLSAGHMPEFGPEEALTLAANGVLLDARIRPNYIGGPVAEGQAPRGHIPGAISAPAPDNVTDYGNFTDAATLAEMYAALGADGSRPVGVYCGAGMSAAHTVLALASIGVTAAMYPGSWSAWVHDPARPVVIGARPHAKTA
ncbi:sulfurtransferase [Rhizobium sp. SSA_523]|uniref:sulfurtransferase n=1 Tax=Rhizobium sp. SSA_523 TaxID=2952477 RepID=UPI002090CFC2|nr:sulfurtransferase [Rhizobium sp. SSA_523]MCO5732223.1 sulfurtransferase [Rhizobium sp. SSA_523]WKC21366.1 sulfurtransferase [Rhizobium sp. SSA_523]